MLAATAQAYAGQVDINFSDLTGDGTLPGNYAGLTWTGGYTYYSDLQPPYDVPPGSPSLERVYTFNATGIAFGGPVTFEGSWFAGNDISAPYWVGYNALGNPIPGDQSTPDTSLNSYVNLDWPGVYSVGLFSSDYDQFIVDDIKYSTGSSSVPDASSTSLMLGLGLAGFSLLRRKIA